MLSCQFSNSLCSCFLLAFSDGWDLGQDVLELFLSALDTGDSGVTLTVSSPLVRQTEVCSAYSTSFWETSFPFPGGSVLIGSLRLVFGVGGIVPNFRPSHEGCVSPSGGRLGFTKGSG